MSSTSSEDQRLDSWKAIAEYLRRDVSTVRRWERTLGLPIRRVRGARGHSVFAFKDELDRWLATAALSAAESPLAAGEDAASGPPPSQRTQRFLWPAVVGTAALLGVAVWAFRSPRLSAADLRVAATPLAVVATDRSGREVWRYDFPLGDRTWLPAVAPHALAGSRPDALLVATSASARESDGSTQSGRLLWFTATGALNRVFAIEDVPSFIANSFSAPWYVSDYRLQQDDRGWRVAIAARHYQWWPAMVTIIDSTWQRRGTFVHAGWIEAVRWLSPDRLVAAGFSNDRDGGAIALLDAGALDGQGPVPDDSLYRCLRCGPHEPLRYVVFPRSEVNRASGASFNLARLMQNGDRLVVHTLETPENSVTGPAEVIYELSPTLEVVSATYGDRYWDLHRSLEDKGVLQHTKANCPDRLGPPPVQVWEPGKGWRPVAVSGR